MAIEISCYRDVFPEEIVELVDEHCLVPVYSYLPPEDEKYLIRRAHERCVSSVVLTEAVRKDLVCLPAVDWCSVKCKNRGLLHLYSTEVGVEHTPCFPEFDVGIGID